MRWCVDMGRRELEQEVTRLRARTSDLVERAEKAEGRVKALEARARARVALQTRATGEHCTVGCTVCEKRQWSAKQGAWLCGVAQEDEESSYAGTNTGIG